MPAAEPKFPDHPTPKRLVVCCDGTWQNSDLGYDKPTFWNPVGRRQIPSNVTRMSRSLKHQCSDGRLQIIHYQSGVGTGSTLSEVLAGGAFGLGIEEHIREAYSFITNNYVDGDEIVLVGFSRGAFTARSVAGMIADLGLLTREGMDHFYQAFKDMQNWQTKNYRDPFPNDPFPNKPRGKDAGPLYRQRLVELGYTRDRESAGERKPITVKAVGVWDTVGSLGIPNTTWLSRLGIPRSTAEYRFYDTNISDKLEYAFQALALDEQRPPFTPAVWERTANDRNYTKIRQCWFPGNHGNIGGGWADYGIANLSLAWMMDQLSSIGVEFEDNALDHAYADLMFYYTASKPTNDKKWTPSPSAVAKRSTSTSVSSGKNASKNSGALILAPPPAKNPSWLARLFGAALRQWAAEPIYTANWPVRPWGFGELISAENVLFRMAGTANRTPGLYQQVDPDTGRPNGKQLKDTNERIHASVRVRLAGGGLALDDMAPYDAASSPALLRDWRLERVKARFVEPMRNSLAWGPSKQHRRRTLARLEGRDDDDVEDQPDGGRDSKNVDDHNHDHLSYDDDDNDDAARNGGGEARWVWRYVGSEKPDVKTLVEARLGPWERYYLQLAKGKIDPMKVADGINPKDLQRLRRA